MDEKTYKRSRAAYNTINKIFHNLNDYTDQGYEAIQEIKGQKSLPWEIKDLITRCWEVLDTISETITEEDFMWLNDLEDFLQDNKPKANS